MTRAHLPLLALTLAAACMNEHVTVSQSDATIFPDAELGEVDAGEADTGEPDALPVDAGDSDPTPEQILVADWQRLVGAPTVQGKQDDLFFIDGPRGWSVNGLGQIHRTEDGGDTWTKQLDQPGTYFRSVLFLDEERGFAGNLGTGLAPTITDERPLFRTLDGGATWTAVTEITGPMPKGICNMQRTDETHLIAVGRVNGPSYFLSSSDSGATWTSIDLDDSIGMLIDARFTTPERGFIVGGSSVVQSPRAVILATEDGGTTWTEIFRGAGSPALAWKISFPTPDVGYVSVQGAGPAVESSFLKTVDGGATWQELPLVAGPYAAKGVGFITSEIGWMAGGEGNQPAYRTSDGGLTWEEDPSLGPLINRFRFVGPRTGYAIGASIYKLVIE